MKTNPPLHPPPATSYPLQRRQALSSPATSHPPLVTRPDDEVLVRVEGVSKKFCRSLKKSLWYGVCDIAGELLPGRKRQRVAGSELRVAGEEGPRAAAGSELLVTSEEGSRAVAGSELLVTSGNTSAEGGDRAEGASGPATSYSPQRRQALLHPLPVTRHSLPPRRTSTLGMMIYGKENFTRLRMLVSSYAGGN